MALYKQILIIYQAIFAYFFNFSKKIIWQLKKIEAKYYFNSRQKQIAVILLIVIAGIFLFYQPANATIVGDAVRGIINWLCLTLIVVFGKLLNMLISFLMEIAKYNNFIYAPVVAQGWKLTRDVCNMFFVIVLLVIAFATVLRIQTYSYKNLLRKLIIMALLINFSKTICGFLIDFAQVIMLTFVNAFRNAGYNLVEMLKLTKILQLAQAGGQNVDEWNITGALVIGLLLLIIACVVVVIFLLVLLIRIVYLWLLVTLSPLAFFLSSFPSGQQYASRWWDYFTKQLVVGPLLAFFLWLSLAAASGGLNVTTTVGYTGQEGYVISDENLLQGKTGGTEAAQSFASEALTPTNMLSFLASIALLLAGLVIAQEAGGLTGSIAGKGLAKIQGMGTGALALGKRAARGAAGTGATWLSQGKETSLRGRFRDVLGRVGGGNIPVVRGLATRTLVGLEGRKRAVEEQAQKYVSNIKDTRILARMANQRGITPYGKAVKEAARNRMPTGIGGIRTPDLTAITTHINQMNRDNLQKVGMREWAEMGKSGINVQGEALDYIMSNRSARRSYNEGVWASGAGAAGNWITGRRGDRNDLGFDEHYGNFNMNDVRGVATAASLNGGVIPAFDAAASRFLRGMGGAPVVPGGPPTPVRGGFAYRTTGELEELRKEMKPEEGAREVTTAETRRGEGNFSAQKFGRGKTNTVFADYDKLNLEFLKKSPRQRFQDMKGFSTSDKGQVKLIADKMVSVIDTEINRLKSIGGKGNERAIDNLQKARERFAQPEKIDHLNLVNSSARGYGLKDAGTTMVHEEFHEKGWQPGREAEVESMAQAVVYGRKHDLRGKPPSAEEVVAKTEKAEKEDKKIIEEEAGEMTSGSPESQTIINNIVASPTSATDKSVFRDIAYLLRRLNNSLGSQTTVLRGYAKNLAGISDIDPEKATPLEISVIAEKIKNEVGGKPL